MTISQINVPCEYLLAYDNCNGGDPREGVRGQDPAPKKVYNAKSQKASDPKINHFITFYVWIPQS